MNKALLIPHNLYTAHCALITDFPMWQYTLLLRVLALPLLLLTLWQAARHGGRRYLTERLGLHRTRIPAGALWVHAASVGEVHTVVPLMMALRQRDPARPMLLTTVTPTGAQAAERRLGATTGVIHAYLPLDWPGAVRRFLRRTRPACALIMETEIWPQLYAACERAGIPITVINGRLSPRTLRAGRWLRARYAETLGRVHTVLARNATDQARFVALGAATARVHITGNLKFAAALSAQRIVPLTLGRPYDLAASTHDNEEQQLAAQWLTHAPADSLLVLAPRHPGRAPAILRQLSTLPALSGHSDRIARRSRGEPVTQRTRVYLADTFGELEGFIAGARLVFMGGSLVPVGGHNILEVARQGKAVLFGPHMHNFDEEAQLLLAAHAALQFDTAPALGQALPTLFSQPDTLRHLGQRAQATLAQQQYVLDAYLTALAEACPPARQSDDEA